ncbi:MAG: hypothetical protein RR334_01470 [Clostridia bacterium]
MKKFFTSLCVVLFAVVSLFTFTACGNELIESSNSTIGVYSNGGTSVISGGYLYFVNGTKANDGKVNTFNNVIQGGIYRLPVDANNNIKDGTSLNNAELVVSSLVGFDKGSIFVFGDYIYFATPSIQKNQSGEVLYGLTAFYRKNINGGNPELMYTTAKSADTIDYTYYPVGDNSLYLVIYEKEGAVLKSIRMGKNVKDAQVIASGIKGYIFPDETQKTGNNAYIYYTTTADIASSYDGVNAYKVKPSNTDKVLIGTGKEYSLLTIRGENLFYSVKEGENTIIHISDLSKNLDISTDIVISYKSYDKILFLADGSIIYSDETVESKPVVMYLKWENSVLTSYKVYEGKTTFIGVTSKNDTGYLVFVDSSDSSINSIDYTTSDKTLRENIEVTLLSDDAFVETKGNMTTEIIGNYVYGFVEKAVGTSTTKKVYMYRVSLDANKKEVDKKEVLIGAEFIGKVE